MSEEAKTIKMTPDQEAKAQREFLKRQATDLASYKKRLREGNDLKKLQVEELELNIRYYEGKRHWFDLRGPMAELEAEEQKILAEERIMRAELQKQAEAEKPKITLKPKAGKAKASAKKPEIIIPEQGKARAK